MSDARVCLVSEIFHPEDEGGQGQQAFALTKGLLEHGCHVQVVTRRNFATSSRHDTVAGIDIRRLPPPGLFKGRGWSAVLPTLWFLLSLLIHLLRRARCYDVIVVQGAKAILLPPMIVARLCGKKCIVKVDAHAELEEAISAASLARMNRTLDSRLLSTWNALRLRLLRSADAIVAISAEIEATLLRTLGADVRIARIPNGIDVQRFAASGRTQRELRAALGLPADGVLLTYTGRLSHAKGLPRLLEVWARIAPRWPDARLVLVGGDACASDSCEAQLRDSIARTGLEERVILTGQVDDVRDYLYASDLFVFPSDSEGFGLALVEAMAAGLPCVSTAVGVAPELIRSHDNGWLIAARDERALESALETALSQQSNWRSMGERARRSVQAFSIGAVVSRFVDLIDTVRAPDATAARSSVRRNAAGLLACRIAADTLNFVLFLIVSNRFGPAGMGVYAYGFALAGFVYAATTLGIDEFGIREYVRRTGPQRARLLPELLGMQGIVSLVVATATVAYLYVTSASVEMIAIVATLCIYQWCAAIAITLFVPSMAEQRMIKPALILFATRAAAFVATGALTLSHASLAHALLPFAAAGLLMMCLAARSARAFGARLRPHVSRPALRDALRSLWSFAAVDLMSHLFTRVAVVGLVLWSSESAAGIYAAGLKLAEVACMPLLFLGQAAYPTLTALHSEPAAFRHVSRRAIAWGSLVAALIALAMALLTPILLVPALGAGYAGSERVIAAMASLACVQGIEIVLGRLLLSANQSVARAKWIAVGAMVCAVMTAALTPAFGVAGAITASVSAYLIVDVLYLRALSRHLRVAGSQMAVDAMATRDSKVTA